MLAAIGWMVLGALLMLVGICALAYRNIVRTDKRVVLVQVPADPVHDAKVTYKDSASAVLNHENPARRRVVNSA
jgi:hypothetical protein